MESRFNGGDNNEPVSVKGRKVTLIYGGIVTKEFKIKNDDDTILEAARDEGLELPAVCESGTCTHCVGRIAAGSVD